jgi:hypothetical protein
MPQSPETRRDLLSAAGLAAVAVAYLVANRAHPLDSLATPGPGVFPLLAGLLMLAAAAGQAVAAARAHPLIRPGRGESPGRRRVLILTAVLLGYPIAAGAIGFLTASFAVVLATSRLLGARDWLRPVALAAGVTAAVHVIFVAWLGVRLPSSLLP